MEFALTTTIVFLLLVPGYVFAYPLCADSRTPLTLNSPLEFCSHYGVTACCNTSQDAQFQKQFQAMNISNSSGCASVMKSILCSRCDPFSSELFTSDSSLRQIPVLCNSTVSASSSQSDQAHDNFCSKVWHTCQNVSMLNSPFTTASQGQSTKSNFSKINDVFGSETDFCNTFGGPATSGSLCFPGEPVTLNSTETTPLIPSGLCIEKIGNGSYLDMAHHPDGSDRAFFVSQSGKIFLGRIPKQGSGEVIELDESNPFLDLSDEVHYDSELGLMGVALHPKFNENGRFFVSFNCDRSEWPGCSGRCSCNSDVGCDPSKLPSDNGAQPCRYSSVVSEYTVDDASTKTSLGTKAKPREVRRIFTMGLPFTSHHAGQILFGPEDGYLYIMMGDGGGLADAGDPYNFAQNKKSLLGKIMRLDVDHYPKENHHDLWGNYSIPEDNPYIQDKELQPEIWALGLRNPWRCSFDAERPSYFLCSDVGQDTYEEVNIITRGGNYGWRVYEGKGLYNPPMSPGGNTSADSISPIFPVMGYNHSDPHITEGSASIIGGFFYRSLTDPCMYGRYLFADLYGYAIWGGIESPEGSGNFSIVSIPFTCAADSPIACTWVTPGSTTPALRYVFSFGQDNNKDVFIMASSGVYRIVAPSRCKFACSKETTPILLSPGPSPSSMNSGYSSLSCWHYKELVLLLTCWLLSEIL